MAHTLRIGYNLAIRFESVDELLDAIQILMKGKLVDHEYPKREDGSPDYAAESIEVLRPVEMEIKAVKR